MIKGLALASVLLLAASAAGAQQFSIAPENRLSPPPPSAYSNTSPVDDVLLGPHSAITDRQRARWNETTQQELDAWRSATPQRRALAARVARLLNGGDCLAAGRAAAGDATILQHVFQLCRAPAAR